MKTTTLFQFSTYPKCFVVFLVIFGAIKTVTMSKSSRFKPVKAVIFDMDGLLLDTETIYFNVHSEIVRRFNKTYTKELQLQVLGTQSASKSIVETLGLDISPADYQEEYEKLCEKRLSGMQFMPGAEKLIRHFHSHQVPMAVATSNIEKFLDLLTDEHKKIFNLFHHIVTGGSDPAVIHGKPAPDIFLVCMQRFQKSFTPEQMLVFEDAPHGVLGAKNAGMQVVMVPEPTLPQSYRINATKVLTSLAEFRPEEFGLPPYSSS